MDLTTFNPDDYSETTGEAMPPGWYAAKIVKAEWKETRAQTGYYLELEWYILGVHENETKEKPEAHKGRRVWDRLNLKNPNEVAVGIAKKTLAKTMNAVGVRALTNGEVDLLEMPCLIRLKYLPENADWDARNEVHGFKKLSETSPFYIGTSSGGNSAKPWEKAIQEKTVTSTKKDLPF